jgi:hypothetical protein
MPNGVSRSQFTYHNCRGMLTGGRLTSNSQAEVGAPSPRNHCSNQACLTKGSVSPKSHHLLANNHLVRTSLSKLSLANPLRGLNVDLGHLGAFVLVSKSGHHLLHQPTPRTSPPYLSALHLVSLFFEEERLLRLLSRDLSGKTLGRRIYPAEGRPMRHPCATPTIASAVHELCCFRHHTASELWNVDTGDLASTRSLDRLRWCNLLT